MRQSPSAPGASVDEAIRPANLDTSKNPLSEIGIDLIP